MGFAFRKGVVWFKSVSVEHSWWGEGCELGILTSFDLFHLSRTDACGSLGECGAGKGSEMGLSEYERQIEGKGNSEATPRRIIYAAVPTEWMMLPSVQRFVRVDPGEGRVMVTPDFQRKELCRPIL